MHLLYTGPCRFAASRCDIDKWFLQIQTGKQAFADFTLELAERIKGSYGRVCHSGGHLHSAVICQEDRMVTTVFDLPAWESLRHVQPDSAACQSCHLELRGHVAVIGIS